MKLIPSIFGSAGVLARAFRSYRRERARREAERLVAGLGTTEALVLWDRKNGRVMILKGSFAFEVHGEDKRMICEAYGWKKGGLPAMRRLNLGRIARAA